MTMLSSLTIVMVSLLLFFLVTKSCPTLYNALDCNPPGSSIHGISQARILEWVAVSFSRGSSWLRNRTHLLHWREILYHWATREAQTFHYVYVNQNIRLYTLNIYIFYFKDRNIKIILKRKWKKYTKFLFLWIVEMLRDLKRKRNIIRG